MSGLVSEVGSLVGGGNNNSQFTASGTPIVQPTTVGQANTAYGGVQNALTQQQALAQALQAQGTQGMSTQAALTHALQAQAAGGGPNPAQAALNQNTGTNVANQAALMAGQRGASSNVGLIARQAAQQGAATQQAAVGQGATLQAQQELAAQQQLQGLAASQVGQSQGATNANTTAQAGEQGTLLNSINSQNTANVQMQSNQNNANSAMAQTNANNAAGFTSNLLGGGLSGAGATSMGSALTAAKGGEVSKDTITPPKGKNKKTQLPEHIRSLASIYHPKHFADGGNVEEGAPQPIADESPLKQSSGGGASSLAPLLMLAANKGAVVPGNPKVNHNDVKNDVVPALLTPKEIVLPLSVTEADDAPEKAKQFVEALIAKQGKSSGKEEGDFKQALKVAISSRRKK